MESKTLTFKFIKKTFLKFSEASTGFKLGKKKIYGIQLLEFAVYFGLSGVCLCEHSLDFI